MAYYSIPKSSKNGLVRIIPLMLYIYIYIYTKTKNKGFLGSLEQPPTIPSFDSKRHRFEGNHLLHPIDVTDGGNVTEAFFPLGLGLPFGSHRFGLKWTAVCSMGWKMCLWR